MARWCLFALLVCLVYSVAAYEDLQPTTYAQLAPVKGQWNITVEATRESPDAFMPVTCDQAAVQAPCNQPLLTADRADKLKLTYTLAGSGLKTLDDLAPKGVRFVACYATPSTADRPWRKANPVMDKDKSCPFIIKDVPINANGTYTVTWLLPKNTTKAAWYTQVRVQCQNGSLTSYCQFDTTQNQTYWATNIINSTPVGLKVATAICSAVGPLFLIAFFLRDYLTKGK